LHNKRWRSWELDRTRIESRFMGSVNKVILVGNLGRDAELRYTPGGAAVSKFSVATTEVWNDKSGQRQERTEWHNIDLWGKQAESLSGYLVKGKQVYVEGRLQTDEYTDKDGNKRKTTRVRCDRVVLLGGAGRGAGTGTGQMPRTEEHMGPGPMPPGPEPSEPLTEDDIPF
jgi:single-strand DNA-binding protein